MMRFCIKCNFAVLNFILFSTIHIHNKYTKRIPRTTVKCISWSKAKKKRTNEHKLSNFNQRAKGAKKKFLLPYSSLKKCNLNYVLWEFAYALRRSCVYNIPIHTLHINVYVENLVQSWRYHRPVLCINRANIFQVIMLCLSWTRLFAINTPLDVCNVCIHMYMYRYIVYCVLCAHVQIYMYRHNHSCPHHLAAPRRTH